jgi:hypothetical protein
MYADELRSVFCQVAGISPAELATEQWASRLGVVFSEVGQPIIRATAHVKGRSVPIRDWTAKLRNRLKSDAAERKLIADLKSGLAQPVFEIQTTRAAELTKSRASAGAKRTIRRRPIPEIAEQDATGPSA